MITKGIDVSDLDNLLMLDGETFALENGYWVKFEAKQVAVNSEIPHGIKYSLTLHDRHNQRVIGYDNGHSYKPRRGKYGAKKKTWDHLHRKMEVFPYEFSSALQLIEDFWKSVDTYMETH